MDVDKWIESLDSSAPLGGRRVVRRLTKEQSISRWGDKTREGTGGITYCPDITDADGTWVPLYSGWIAWRGYGLLEME